MSRLRQAVPLRVLVVYSDPLLRDVIGVVLKEAPDIELMQQCHRDAFTPEILNEVDPDAVIVDWLPAPGFIDVIEEVARRTPRAQLIHVSLKRGDLLMVQGRWRERASIDELLVAIRSGTTTPGNKRADRRRAS